MTRLAPSPTGTLHLGNALTFVVNWALARRLGWRVVLRIEDLDRSRVREGAADEAVAVLGWLGLDWDDGPIKQSDDLSPYRQALEQLRAAGLLYPCDATRKEIAESASAPHTSDGQTRYPGINRPPAGPLAEASREVRDVLGDDAFAWRVMVPDGEVAFVDEVLGPQSVNVQQQVGDFALATKAGLPAYQLAVVVDDARQGVTDVVRGDDLLMSTPRQIVLYRLLGLEAVPRYWHLPLVTGADGRRMAKRHDSVRLTTHMEAGIPGERIVGLLAKWAGLTDQRQPMSPRDFAARLDPDRLGYDPPAYTDEDEQWLMQSN